MTSGWTQYLEKKILDLVFGNQSYSIPTTLYLGICTGGCTDAGVVTGEPTIGALGYARVVVTNNNTNFPNCTTDGTKNNGVTLTFPEASGSWGTISTYVWFDASTGGNALVYADVTTPKAVVSGDTPKINAGDMTLTLD
jgi:hypothetical protein